MSLFVLPEPEHIEPPPDKGRRKLLYRFLDYREKISKGNQWIAIVEEYIPIQKGVDIITTIFSVKVAIEHHTWTWYLIAIGIFAGYKIFWEMLRLGIAIVYYRTGAWKAQIDWEKKNEKYQGPEIEKRRTIASIAEKVGAENYIKDLHE